MGVGKTLASPRASVEFCEGTENEHITRRKRKNAMRIHEAMDIARKGRFHQRTAPLADEKSVPAEAIWRRNGVIPRRFCVRESRCS